MLYRVVALVLAVSVLLSSSAIDVVGGTTPTDFPSRVVRIVVPFPPGGPTDLMARAYAENLSQQWGQPVVIENRAGSNSSIGAQAVARAPADGYTLLIAMDNTLVLNPLMFPNLPYDPQKDFTPISLTAENTSLLIVPADGPKTALDLIAKGKGTLGKLNYGAGVAATRLAGSLFSKLAGFETQFIPYKGSAEVVQGLLTGSIDFAIDGIATSLPLLQNSQLRALAKLNNRPLASLPELQPLAIAAHLPELEDISTWAGLVAPAGTPPAVIDVIQRAAAKAATNGDLRQRLDKLGIAAVSSTPDEFHRYIARERDRWSKVVRESGMKFD